MLLDRARHRQVLRERAREAEALVIAGVADEDDRAMAERPRPIEPALDQRRADLRATVTLVDGKRAEQEAGHGRADPDRPESESSDEPRLPRRAEVAHHEREPFRRRLAIAQALCGLGVACGAEGLVEQGLDGAVIRGGLTIENEHGSLPASRRWRRRKGGEGSAMPGVPGILSREWPRRLMRRGPRVR